MTLSGRLTSRSRTRWLNEHAKSGHSRGTCLVVDTCVGWGLVFARSCVCRGATRMATVFFIHLLRGLLGVALRVLRGSRNQRARVCIFSFPPAHADIDVHAKNFVVTGGPFSSKKAA